MALPAVARRLLYSYQPRPIPVSGRQEQTVRETEARGKGAVKAYGRKLASTLVAALLLAGFSATANANYIAAVPEPDTLALLAIGLIGIGVALSRRRKQK